MLTISKQDIRRSFSKSAQTYDALALPQKCIASRLVDQALACDSVNQMISDSLNRTVVDIGSGTGYVSNSLYKSCQLNGVIRIDISESMLNLDKEQVGKGRQGRNISQNQWLCADAESLPLINNTADIIFSSYAFQWCQSLPILFTEMFRVLKSGGLLCFSIPGPGTFAELDQSWSDVDKDVHVNSFSSKESILSALKESGFSCVDAKKTSSKMRFDQATDAMAHIKKIGAHNMSANRRKTLMGKERFSRFIAAYESKREEGGLPLSYETISFIAIKK